MARRKRGAKSAAVRAILEQNPNAPIAEIISTLAAKKMKVSHNLVYGIKAKMHHKQHQVKRQKVMVTSQRMSNGSPAEMIRKVRAFADEFGGIKSLKELVDALAE